MRHLFDVHLHSNLQLLLFYYIYLDSMGAALLLWSHVFIYWCRSFLFLN